MSNISIFDNLKIHIGNQLGEMKADKDSMFSVVDPYLSLTSQNLSAQLIILRYENVDHRAVLTLLAFQLFNDASQVASLLLLICDHRPKLFVHLPEKRKITTKNLDPDFHLIRGLSILSERERLSFVSEALTSYSPQSASAASRRLT